MYERGNHLAVLSKIVLVHLSFGVRVKSPNLFENPPSESLLFGFITSPKTLDTIHFVNCFYQKEKHFGGMNFIF